jgi:hypothetical protein
MKNKKSLPRVEFKYTFDNRDYNKVLQDIHRSELFFTKQYDDRKVNSIYFDTYNHQQLNRAREGYYEKEKFRYRYYQELTPVVNGQWEVKKKLGIVTIKDVFQEEVQKNDMFNKIANYNISSNEKVQFYLKKFSHLNSLVSYHRKYFVSSKYGVDLRLTIDTGIKTSKYVNGSISREKLYNNNVIEIKISKTLYEDEKLNRILSFPRVGFSKYSMA